MSENIKKIIKEEIENFLKEQDVNVNTKKTAIENINKQVRLLKLMKSTVGQIKMPPEFQKMADELKKADTTKFFEQFLKVNDDVPVKVEAVLTNPLALISAVIDEVVNNALKNAKQKLALEEDKIKRLGLDDPQSRKEKHDRKKKVKEIPSPKLEEDIDVDAIQDLSFLLQEYEGKFTDPLAIEFFNKVNDIYWKLEPESVRQIQKDREKEKEYY